MTWWGRVLTKLEAVEVEEKPGDIKRILKLNAPSI